MDSHVIKTQLMETQYTQVTIFFLIVRIILQTFEKMLIYKHSR